ncbi:hypothetical protein CR513_38510, partial [Mucuna pruriens]
MSHNRQVTCSYLLNLLHGISNHTGLTLERPITQSRLRRIQEEVQHQLTTLKDPRKGQASPIEVRRNLECRKMGSSSVNWEGLSPKSRYILDTMKELREKLDLVGKSLDLVQKDAHRTNNKVEALSKAKEEGVGGHSGHSRSSHSSKEER